MNPKKQSSQFAQPEKLQRIDRSKCISNNNKLPNYSQKQLVRARVKYAQAQAWRKDNPSLWAYIDRSAHERASRGETISGASLLHQARSKDWVDKSGQTAGINNDFAPIIARWLIIDSPELEPYIEKRGSVMDMVML